MPTGQVNTFNVPNYVGELFGITPTDTPFLAAIGGLTGGETTNSTIFTWQSYDLRDAADDRQAKEGADAPDPEYRKRTNDYNVVEIHHEAVEVSYTKMAATGQYASTGSNADNAVGIDGSNPVGDELSWQTQRALEQVARDVEKTFLKGTFDHPSDNDKPRKTRGLLEAISTNVVDLEDGGDPGDLTDDAVLDLLQKVWENGGIRVDETATIISNATQKRKLTELFISGKGYEERTRDVGGVNLQTIETDFGRLNIMLNRYMPKDQLAVASLDECAPVFLNIPGKGFLFQEQLALAGSAEKYQIYGEIGLRYGNERAHGKITGLKS